MISDFRLFCLLLCCASAGVLRAHDVEVDGVCYNFLVGGRAYVTYRGNSDFEPDGYAGDVVVPAEFSHNGSTYRVVSVGPSAFAGCERLTSVQLPPSVRALSGSSFLGCTALRRVTLPEGYLSMSSCSFTGCLSLQEVVFPRKAEFVDTLSLYCCASLSSLTLPHRIRTIRQGGLEHLPSLRHLYCYASLPPTCEPGAFFLPDQQRSVLHVPAMSLQAYREASGWSDFREIVPISDAEFEAEGYVRGDVNADGSVDAEDLALLRRIVVSLPDDCAVHWAADMNGDGKVGAADYVELARRLSGR